MRSSTLSIFALLFMLAAMWGCGPSDSVLFSNDTAIIMGLVVDGDFKPVVTATVELQGNAAKSGFTDKNGNYELTNIAPNQYDVVAWKEIGGARKAARLRFIRLNKGMTLSMPDLRLQDTGSITGTVLTTGQSDHSNVKVEVVGTTHDTNSSSTGTYSLSNIETGIYSLYLSKVGYIGQTLHNISVAPGGSTTVAQMILQPVNPSQYGAVSGNILLEAARNGDHSGTRVTILGTTRSLITTSDGAYRFNNLPVSGYTIQFEHDRYFTHTKSDVYIPAGTAEVPLGDLTLSNHRRINEHVRAWGLALSPSGSQIAYINNNSLEDNEIALIDPTGSIFNQTITNGSRVAAERGLAWSPDEKEILYTRYIGAPINAYTISVTTNTGSETHDLVTSGTDYFFPTFSPDGRYVSYFLTQKIWRVETERGSQGKLFTTTSTTTEVANLVANAQEWTAMEWANTGRILYSTDLDILPEHNAWTVLASGIHPPVALEPKKAGNPLDSVEAPIHSAAFSPDWGRVAFATESATTGNDKGIWVVDVDGFNAIRISEASGKYIQWTPDGKKLYYVDEDQRINELLLPSF